MTPPAPPTRDPRARMRRSGADGEEIVRSLAARQHGAVTRDQLLAAGVSPRSVERRLAAGRLVRAHRGVYLLAHVEAPFAREMAAALACGAGAAVSHGSAGILWQMRPRSTAAPRVEMLVTEGPRRKPGIRVRRTLTLRRDEVTALERIPVTTPARTLYDLARPLRPRELQQALALAFERSLTTAEELRTLLTRHRGAPNLRLLLDGGPPVRLLSEAEQRFLALTGRAGAPKPEVVILGHQVDFLWREERLVVEVDGFGFHASREAFESDRSRDSELAAGGVRVMRITWKQLENEPERISYHLGCVLALPARL